MEESKEDFFERLNRQFDFIRTIDREKEILRQTYKTDLTRENDAEHAWHMAKSLKGIDS